jgi:hypothetical protein
LRLAAGPTRRCSCRGSHPHRRHRRGADLLAPGSPAPGRCGAP